MTPRFLLGEFATELPIQKSQPTTNIISLHNVDETQQFVTQEQFEIIRNAISVGHKNAEIPLTTKSIVGILLCRTGAARGLCRGWLSFSTSGSRSCSRRRKPSEQS